MIAGDGPGRMSVAHFVDSYLGLTETFIHDTLIAFRRVRPVVIARGTENMERFPLPRGATIHLSPPSRGSAAWASAALRRRLRGGDPHLERILERERIRVMHAHFGPTACALLETKRRVRLPLITSFYGYDASMISVIERLGEEYRRLFETGDAFLVEGAAMRRRLLDLGCPASKLRIHPIGIDPARYRFHAREGPREGPVWLLQCGRMVPKKGYPTGLQALREARRHDARLRLRIIGDGPERPAIERLIRELDLGEAVVLLGSRPRGVFLEELDRAHVYFQPSMTAPDGDSEGGAPTSLLEAQASGLPVLSTRHADIPEVVREGESALLTEEGDVDGLASGMVSLASRPEHWPSMGRAGREHVERRHDVRRLAAELEVLYGAVAGRAREAGRVRLEG